jgi:hypothetical protein
MSMKTVHEHSFDTACSHRAAPSLPSLGEYTVLIIMQGDRDSTADFLHDVRRFERDGPGTIDGVDLRTLNITSPEAANFIEQNPWVHDVPALPYAVIYHHGQIVEGFPAFHASFLVARLQRHALAAAGSQMHPMYAEQLFASVAD